MVCWGYATLALDVNLWSSLLPQVARQNFTTQGASNVLWAVAIVTSKDVLWICWHSRQQNVLVLAEKAGASMAIAMSRGAVEALANLLTDQLLACNGQDLRAV